MSVAKSIAPALGAAALAALSGQRPTDRPRVLVCDHESQTLRALRVVLQGSGFWMDPVRTAAGALSHSALRAPDAAIIALELPDGDGVEVCRCLREWSAMPVILLSSVNDEQELVRALEAGADDFVTKPFRPRELVARLNAKLRRAVPAAAEPRVELHGLEIDLARRSVRRDGEDIHLTPIEFKLLAVLLRNRGRLLTHRALLAAVWGAAYVSDRRTLRAHIANLRRKIEPAEGVRLIRTDHRVGYRLAAESSGSDGPSWPIEEAVDPSLTRDLLVRVEAPAPADGVSASRRLRDAYGRVA